MKAIGIFALCAGAAWGACGDRASGERMLVSGAWLAGHLKDSNLVVLAVGDEKEYAAGHIPGARFLPYMDTHSMESPGGLTVELLPMPELEKNFSRLGVSNDSRVILYFTGNQVTYTTRVFLTLDAMGMGAQTSLLDGGYGVWKGEGRPVTGEVPKVTPGNLKACPRPEVIADLDYVKSHLKASDVRIIDARLPEYYTGAKKPGGQRLGHIPGAANVPFVSLFDEQNKLKPRAEVAASFAAAGVTQGKQMVSYCHIGQQATAVYFAARYLGIDARMYDGSWEEWSKHTELPNEVSEGKK
jgi:thiosulfate/3-mercaptopyruvate sulfurtransferase